MEKHETYDVAIVGSGIGGLCAAALLAHSGYRILIVEKSPLLGGRFSTLNYRGFKITTGAVWVAADGPLRQTFDEVGAEFEIRCPQPYSHYRIAGGYHQLPAVGRLRFLLSKATDNQDAVERVLGAIKRGLAWREPSEQLSLKDWLSDYSMDRNILDVFQGMTTSWQGVNVDEVSAHEYFRMLKESSKVTTFGLPPKGNLGLVEELARVIRARGGTIWTRTRVKRICVEHGTATGIEVEQPDKSFVVVTKAVISDVGPTKTIEMVGVKALDRGYLNEVREKIRPIPMVLIHAVSNKPLTEYPGALVLTGTRRVGLAVCPTLTCPELAPKGKHLLLTYGTPTSCLLPLRAEDEIRLNLLDIADVFPTFHRDGEVLMVSCFHKEWPSLRSWPGFGLDQKTPVENLYLVGDGVLPSGWTGLSAVALTARIAVEDLRKRMN